MYEPSSAKDLFDLTGRVAIVTGASSGLGDRFARVLAGAGAKVVAGARRRDRLDTLVADLPDAVAVSCDVVVEEDLKCLVETAVDVYGRLDVVVNNAGISNNVRGHEETRDEWDSAVAVNLTAVWRLSQLAAEVMFSQGSGVIVNIASMYGLVGRGDIPIGASYPATKGAVVNLTRELGAAWARRGIRVNALAPGYFPTEMTADTDDNPRFIARLERRSPLRRMGELHELDGALLFLSSEASSYVVGQTLAVDGGWTAI